MFESVNNPDPQQGLIHCWLHPHGALQTCFSLLTCVLAHIPAFVEIHLPICDIRFGC